LNVRTYVSHGSRPVIWFFSLDASSRLAVEAARLWFALPYFHARMRIRHEPEGWHYSSARTDRRGKGETLEARYAPSGPPARSEPGTLEHFLTERYCLYAERRGGTLLRGEIHHPPWELRGASARFARNTLAGRLGVDLSPEPDLVQFSALQRMVAWAPEVVG
jgi:uncharacterized protein YqjF (DUF2071 family)